MCSSDITTNIVRSRYICSHLVIYQCDIVKYLCVQDLSVIEILNATASHFQQQYHYCASDIFSKCNIQNRVRHFPKGDFLSDNFPSGNFPIVQFPKWQFLDGQVGPSKTLLAAMWAKHCSQYRQGGQALRLKQTWACSLANCTDGKLQLEKITVGSCNLGK